MIFFFLCLYALVDGLNNAVLYSRKGASAFKWNEHFIFLAQRGSPYLAACFAAFYGFKMESFSSLCILIGGELISSALAFSYFHNGIYAEARDRIAGDLNDFKYNWRYSSPTDTSKINFTYRERLWMFVASLVLMASVNIMLGLNVI